jgi:4-hydroxy-4-methyl-2-oxoglutarate aldolase
MLSSIGSRVYTRIDRAPDDAIRRLAKSSVCNIADVMHGMNVIDGVIAPIYTPMADLAGPCVTVDLTPGDGLMLRKAITLAQPGDVLVVNGHACSERAILGGTACIYAAQTGIAGMIVDGAVRDIGEARDLGFPIFARALTARSGSTPNGWGEVNVPVAIGGVVVMPGDVLLASQEGAVVVPRYAVEEVAGELDAIDAAKGTPDQIEQRKTEAADRPLPRIDEVERAMRQRGAKPLDSAWSFPAGA